MTITLTVPTVWTAISNLGISGITVKDINAVPMSARMLCPILFPNPKKPFRRITPSRVTTGGGGSALMDMTYTLNYIYLHCEAKSGVSNFEAEAGCANNVLLIVKTILLNDDISGAVDVQWADMGDIDEINDPAGNKFLGLMFSLQVTEQIQ